MFSASYSRYLLYLSTILDNKVAIYIVNNTNLLVSRLLRKAIDYKRINASTQALLVNRIRTQVIKNLLTSLNSLNTIDLKLTNVRVVKRFYLNIISKACLRD